MTHRARKWLGALAGAGFFASCVGAQEERAEIALSAAREGPFWNGEQIILHLDLKTPALSFSDVRFTLPEVSGALVLQTDSTTVKLSEERSGEAWQVLRYPITVFPQQPGTARIPPFEVRFQTRRGFGSDATRHVLDTRPLTIDVRQPPGLESDQVVVTTPRLEFDSTWDLKASTLVPGDAVTLTVERQATGLSAMLLPPLPVANLEGLAAYPAAPDIDDRTNRGSLVGVRRDRVTWIVEQPGDYQLPALLFRSWDPVQERLDTQQVSGVSFTAEAGVNPSGQKNNPGEPAAALGNRGRWLARAGSASLVILVFGWLAWRFRHELQLASEWLMSRICPPARALLKTLNPGASS